MAVTRLERKGRKNKAVAKKKNATIKLLTDTPVIKKVDVEKIKEEFKANLKSAKPAKQAAPKKAAADKAEDAVEAVAEKAPKAKATKAKPKTAKKTEEKEGDKE